MDNSTPKSVVVVVEAVQGTPAKRQRNFHNLFEAAASAVFLLPATQCMRIRASPSWQDCPSVARVARTQSCEQKQGWSCMRPNESPDGGRVQGGVCARMLKQVQLWTAKLEHADDKQPWQH